MYVLMIRRTTIELDEQLLERAKRALGSRTTRATVEEALRRVVNDVEGARSARASRQRRYLGSLDERADLALMASERMWH
jgi:Arc/MetJ family transcription regulator